MRRSIASWGEIRPLVPPPVAPSYGGGIDSTHVYFKAISEALDSTPNALDLIAGLSVDLLEQAMGQKGSAGNTYFYYPPPFWTCPLPGTPRPGISLPTHYRSLTSRAL